MLGMILFVFLLSSLVGFIIVSTLDDLTFKVKMKILAGFTGVFTGAIAVWLLSMIALAYALV